MHDLPMDGSKVGRYRAIHLARRDVPTCRPADKLGDVHERVRAAGHSMCIVVNDNDVVFGRLRGRIWERDPNATVEEVMELGPTTIRPDIFLHDVIERLRKARAASILVTSYGTHEGGGFLGVLFREDVERVLAEAGPQPDRR